MNKIKRLFFICICLSHAFGQEGYEEYTGLEDVIKSCQKYLSAEGENKKTMNLILEGIKLKTCNDFRNIKLNPKDKEKKDLLVYMKQSQWARGGKGVITIVNLNLSNKKIKSVTPLNMFKLCGTIDLSSNQLGAELKKFKPEESYCKQKINISNNNIKRADVVNSVIVTMNGCVNADNNQIENPESINKRVCSFENNISGKGKDFDDNFQVIFNFIKIYNSGDYSKLSSLLAPTVKKYISFKNVPQKTIIDDLNNFLGKKSQVTYDANFKTLKIEKDSSDEVKASLDVTISWTNPLSSLPSVFNNDSYVSTAYMHRVETKAELILNKNKKIESYKELPKKQKYKVLKKTLWFKRLADIPGCLLEEPENLEKPKNSCKKSKVTGPKIGDILQYKYSKIIIRAGNRSGWNRTLLKLRHKGKNYWGLEHEGAYQLPSRCGGGPDFNPNDCIPGGEWDIDYLMLEK